MIPTAATLISKGNMKIGEKKTWNINLAPTKTCQDKPCFKEGCCYAMKALRLYPQTRYAWNFNFEHYSENPKYFFSDIAKAIQSAKNKPKWFRWHSAGEIPDQNYFLGIKRIARMFPKIKFLVFTKKYDLTFRLIPSNLQVVISAWPGIEIPKNLRKRFPIAWMVDGRETRTPKNGFECPGYCPTCRACWSLSKTKKDVIFHKH